MLALQAGRWWAEQADVDEDDEEMRDDGGAETGAETDRTDTEKEKENVNVRRRDVPAKA